MSRPRGSGTPHSPEGAYARKLGITTRKLRALGGAAKLQALDPDTLAVLLQPNRYGYSRTVMRGGLKARGMLISPRVESSGPIECLMSDEDLVVTRVEGLGE
jgi:hypothetical protein